MATSGRARTPTTLGPRSGRIRDYIAREAFRRYGPIEPPLPSLTRRNIRRNFGVLLPLDLVTSQLTRYKSIYETAAKLLGKYLVKAPPGSFAHPSHVRWDDFVAAISKRYPREPRKVVGLGANYAIYYEYLR
jgi:hypothetical protein